MGCSKVLDHRTLQLHLGASGHQDQDVVIPNTGSITVPNNYHWHFWSQAHHWMSGRGRNFWQHIYRVSEYHNTWSLWPLRTRSQSFCMLNFKPADVIELPPLSVLPLYNNFLADDDIIHYSEGWGAWGGGGSRKKNFIMYLGFVRISPLFSFELRLNIDAFIIYRKGL